MKIELPAIKFVLPVIVCVTLIIQLKSYITVTYLIISNLNEFIYVVMCEKIMKKSIEFVAKCIFNIFTL